MDGKIFVVFFLKVIFDAGSRITILGAWLYTINDGKFCPQLTILYFYSMVLAFVITNVLFSYLEKRERTKFIPYLIGNIILLKWMI